MTPPTPDNPGDKDTVDVDKYDSVADAIAAVPAGGTLKFAAGSAPIADALTVDKAMTIAANGAEFTKPITVQNAKVTVDGAVFNVQGTNSKDTTPAIKAVGSEPFTLTNSEIKGTSRNPILVKTSGAVKIEGNKFDGAGNFYNVIEFSLSDDADITHAEIANNTFTGMTNNCISIYNVADGAVVDVHDNKFENISVDVNPMRLSNPKNANATFNVENNTYTFNSETPNASGYTAFLLCQDYNKSGKRQEFSTYTVNFVNLMRGEKHLTEQGEGLDKVYYTYSDRTNGILNAGTNDPTVSFK